MGEYLSHKIASAEWGDGVVRQLANHISRNCPDVKGFSDKNLWRMKQFYEAYAEDAEKLSALLRQISWTNNTTMLSRSLSPTMVAEYQLCLPDKALLQQKMRELEEEIEAENKNDNK